MPIMPGDWKLFRWTEAAGEVSYKTVARNEVKTYTEDLDYAITRMLDRLEKLVDIAFPDETCDDNLKELFSSLLFSERMRFNEMFAFISRNIGTIQCTGVAHDEDETSVRPGRIVDANITPPDPDAEQDSGPFFNVDPEIIELLKQIPPEKLTAISGILRELREGNDFKWWPVTTAKCDK